MTGRSRTESAVTPSVASLRDDVRTVFEAVGSAMLPRLALIAIALLLILVILPAVLAAAQIHLVAVV